MKNICDYTILRRDKNGFGYGTVKGTLQSAEGAMAVVRVVSEENGVTVLPWQKCSLDGSEWSAQLCIPQGGPYRIEVRQASGEFNQFCNSYDWCPFISIIHYVGVGEIFVMAGQSNMSGYAREPAYDPPELGVHLYDNCGSWVLAAHPLCSAVNPVYPNNDSASGSSPGLAFAKAMKRALGVPVGLVSASLGGSALASWNPAEENPFLYKSMAEKLAETGGATGIIWYQGCNETNFEECSTYYEKFVQTVGLWREEFGSLPIVTCQLNRHSFEGEEDNNVCWGMVREAQRRAAIDLEDVFIIPTIDLPICDGIHNSSSSCIIIGERMAYALLNGYYSLPGNQAPTVMSAEKLDSKTVLLSFNEGVTLKTMDDNADGMNIEDEKGLMGCIKASVSPDGLVVTAEREIEGKAFFHAYWSKKPPAFTVRDVYGMPMLSCYGIEIK